MKNKTCVLLSLFSTLALCIVELFRGIIATYINVYLPIGACLVFFWLLVLLYSLYAVFILINIICTVISFSAGKLAAAILSAVIPLMIFSFPYTELSFELNFRLNESVRNGVAEQIKSGELEDNKIDVQEYRVADLRASYTGTVLYDGDKVLFYLYKGMSGDVVLIWSPAGEEPSPADFSNGLPKGYTYNFETIKKMSDTYWVAYMR